MFRKTDIFTGTLGNFDTSVEHAATTLATHERSECVVRRHDNQRVKHALQPETVSIPDSVFYFKE